MDLYLLAGEVVIVVAMVGVEIGLLLWLLPRSGELPPYPRLILAATALVGSAGLLVSLLWLYEYPNLNSATIVMEAAGIGMGFPPGFWMISVIVFHDRRLEAPGWAWPALVAGLAVAGEMLMGLVLVALNGGAPDTLGWLGATLTEPAYLGSMAGAMAILAFWIPFPREIRIGLLALAASGLAGAALPLLPAATAVAMAGLMGLAVLALLPPLLRPGVTVARARWSTGLLGAMALGTGAGLLSAALPTVDARTAVFGLLMGAIMSAEFLVLVRAGWQREFAPSRAVGTPATPGAAAAELVRPTDGLPA